MKNRIELTIEHKDHYTVELTNDKGDTFSYNPQKYKGLEDFLNGAKTLPTPSFVIPKGTLPYDPKCDDACKFHCTKGGEQYPECLK